MRYGSLTAATPTDLSPTDLAPTDPVTTETLGALLARVRGDQGVTQLRLAARLCAAAGSATVTRHEVSRWEREERIPSGYWLSWLAVALDHPLEELERAAGAARRRRLNRTVRGLFVPPTWEECQPGVYRRAS
jgi:transcriptional regulator with XRE-family HTH domain